MIDLNVNLFRVTQDLSDSDFEWTLERVPARHHSVKRVSRRSNLFEVKIIPEEVVTPLPPGEGASGDNDEFVDVWNDVF